MFHRYKYTCPDVIHMRAVNRKIIYANLIAGVMVPVMITAAGFWLEKQDRKDRERLKVVPND